MKNYNEDMSYSDIMLCLSGGLPQSYAVLLKVREMDKYIFVIKELDYFDIIGDRIYKLFHYCCNDDLNILDETMMLFRFGAFSQDEIINNLETDEPIPFIDSSINYEDVDNDKISMYKNYIFKTRESYYRRKFDQNKTLKRAF